MHDLQDGVLLVRSGLIVLANPAATDILGIQPKGKRIADLCTLEDERIMDRVVRRPGPSVVLHTRLGKKVRIRALRAELVGADLIQITLQPATSNTEEGAMGVSRDISHERQAAEKLRDQEARMRALFESSEHMFWTIGPGVVLTSYNRAYALMLERLYGVAPVINKEAGFRRQRFAPSNYHDFWEEKYQQAFAGKQVRFETDILDRRGARVCNEIFLSPVFDSEGSVKEVFGVGHEVTGQKVAQSLVRAQEARLRAIFESSANMMFWTLDQELRITSFNDHFQHSIAETFGIAVQARDPIVELLGGRVAHGGHGPFVQRYRQAFNGTPQQFEAELVSSNGTPIWVENFINPIVMDGQVQEISCMAYGITDRKQAQHALVQSLYEKEVLLKEVHHRVKNNLQIVSSIFNLQTAHAGSDQRVLDLLRDSRDRIRSMAFIHESLYQNKEFSSVDLGRYIDGLSRNLMLSYSLSGKVGLNTDLQEVPLILDQAIPCGLILNELISNALKHAFPQGRPGNMFISLSLEGNTVSIRVGDDGIGVPPDFNMETHGNLGLELVRTLAEQLDGNVRMTGGPGVSYLLTFERTKY